MPNRRLAFSVVASLAVASFAAAPAEGAMTYVQIESQAVGRKVDAGIYLPPGYDEKARYPVLYFLHGMFGDARKWESRGIPAQLDEMIEKHEVRPMIVVCPDGDNSMYVDWKSGRADWMRFVAEELPAAIEKSYPVVADRKWRGISGDSMGGYGALNVAFQHPDRFAAVSAHSAALYPVDPDELPDFVKRGADRWSEVFGSPVDEEHWRRNNPLHLAATLETDTLKTLAIYFDVGTHDRYGLDATNALLHATLDERRVPHEYFLRDGGHGREFFRENVHHSLAFHDRAFPDADARAAEATPAHPDDDAAGEREY